MKDFFEEYGRTIVTVLIILGITLVGYTIAGNGTKSALGRFTANITDSLSSQTNSLLADSPEGLARSTAMADGLFTGHDGPAALSMTEKEGVQNISVSGKTDNISNKAFLLTKAKSQTPWGQKSIMSFDIMAEKDSSFVLDQNALIEGTHDNDIYSDKSRFSDNGKVSVLNESSFVQVSLKGGKWHHIVLVMENGNESRNPSHLPMSASNTIRLIQDGGDIHYQVKNMKYGNA